MNKRRSPEQYRRVDLLLFALMLLVFESMILLASSRWFPAEPYTVSLVPAVVAIVLVRWGPWAAVHALLGGAVVCFHLHASASQFLIYGLGNLFPLLLLPLLARWRKAGGVWKESLPALAFGLAVLLLMQGGRAAVSLLTGAEPSLAAGYFTTEAVTDLFTLVILWIVRRLDGMLEDQLHYLARVQAEQSDS